jgi:hypothetical protein
MLVRRVKVVVDDGTPPAATRARLNELCTIGSRLQPPERKTNRMPVPWMGVSDDLPDTHELRFALSQLRNSSPGPNGPEDVAILSPNVWTAATDFAAFDEECRRAKTKVIQMPNRFSHHDPAPPPIAPPLCTTPEEQIFYVLPSETSFSAEQVAELRDQPRLCGVNPVARRRTTGSSKLHPAYRCPIAGCDYCGPTGGANHLRAHLDKGHDLRVNVLSVPPQLTLEPVPNLDGQGKLKCDVCAAAFTDIKGLKQHYTKRAAKGCRPAQTHAACP